MIYIFHLDRVSQLHETLDVTISRGDDLREAVSNYISTLYELIKKDAGGALICVKSDESKDNVTITGTHKSYRLSIYMAENSLTNCVTTTDRISMADSVADIIHGELKTEIKRRSISRHFHFSLENSAGVISFDRYEPAESRTSEFACIGEEIIEHMPDVALSWKLKCLVSTENQCVYLIQDEHDAMEVFGTCVVTIE